MSRVACETAANTGLILLLGEISTNAYVDMAKIVRNTVRETGYTRAKFGFDYETCGTIVSIKEQSSDIAQGVDAKDIEDTGAGDQGMMIGYACLETEELMPLPITLAHELCRRLADVRRDGAGLEYLRPDGKSQVTVQYENGIPTRIDTVVIAAQHDPQVGPDVIQRDITEMVIEPVIPADMLDRETKILVNATGRFVVGGPMGDAGLTGRKIIVDTYGGYAPHGGGAFSGKDCVKVDRSGAYIARYLAKNIVASGMANNATTQLSYAIGIKQPTSLYVYADGQVRVNLADWFKNNIDLTPLGIINKFD